MFWLAVNGMAALHCWVQRPSRKCPNWNQAKFKSVCDKGRSSIKTDGWTELVLAWELSLTYPTMCFKEIRVSPTNGTFLGTLSRYLDFENFSTVCWSSLSVTYLRLSTFVDRRPLLVFHTERPPMYTARRAWSMQWVARVHLPQVMDNCLGTLWRDMMAENVTYIDGWRIFKQLNK